MPSNWQATSPEHKFELATSSLEVPSQSVSASTAVSRLSPLSHWDRLVLCFTVSVWRRPKSERIFNHRWYQQIQVKCHWHQTT